MITREDLVVQSAENFIREQMTERGYGPSAIIIRDEFPTERERATELSKTTVATGFAFDDGGTPVELGSDLMRRIYSLEFWVFATTPEYGSNVAHVIRSIFELTYLMPLQDIRLADNPIIDQLQVTEPRGIIVTRQIARDPRPWELYVWSTTVRLEDYYSPSAWLSVPESA